MFGQERDPPKAWRQTVWWFNHLNITNNLSLQFTHSQFVGVCSWDGCFVYDTVESEAWATVMMAEE